jgi:D-glycero-alpha-D-manno-heptose-7-phosphate kinase
MLITKSAMRITFIGGGTDYQSFFKQHPGFSIIASINKFVYVTTIIQPSFVKDLYRFTYRKTESVEKINEIQHPVVREVLKKLRWDLPINIATMADLPESSGLGSSSAFTAAFYQNLSLRKGIDVSPSRLANATILMERKILQEPGGWQDQISTTFGGLRLINFFRNEFTVSNDILTQQLSEYLKPRLILIRTDLIRDKMQSAHATEKIVQDKNHYSDLIEIANYARSAWDKISKNPDPEEIFEVLKICIQTSWQYKSKWGKQIFSTEIQSTIDKIQKNGGLYYKLVGAGGGGFILVADNPSIISKIKQSFDQKDYIDFALYSQGTHTLKYE